MSADPDAGALPNIGAIAGPGIAAVRFSCPRCSAAVERYNGESGACPACGRRLLAIGFPELLTVVAAAPARELAASGEASCFFHPSAAAIRPCEGCGRYLCSLCDIELRDHHYCPGCAENPRARSSQDSLKSSEFLYDSMVLSLSLLWILFWPSWPVVLICCLYVTIRRWKAPRRSLIPRSRWRYVVGLCILALVPALIFLLRLLRSTP